MCFGSAPAAPAPVAAAPAPPAPAPLAEQTSPSGNRTALDMAAYGPGGTPQLRRNDKSVTAGGVGAGGSGLGGVQAGGAAINGM